MAAGVLNLPVLGNHYFDFNNTPTFDLTAHSKIIFAGKQASGTAPAGSSTGTANTAAVAWLYLKAKAGYPSGLTVGLSEVYRVETAGGSSTLCTEASGVISVPYAAEYWFY